MIAQQEDQRELSLETVETANVLTGLETLEELIAESALAPSHDTLEEPIAESAPAPSLDKVRLFHPSRLYFLASGCVLIFVPVRILISPSCCLSISHQLA